MNRRTFFGRACGAVLAAVAAQFVPKRAGWQSKVIDNTSGTVFLAKDVSLEDFKARYIAPAAERWAEEHDAGMAYGPGWMHPSHPTAKRIHEQYVSGLLSKNSGLDWITPPTVSEADFPPGRIFITSGGIGYLREADGSVTTIS